MAPQQIPKLNQLTTFNAIWRSRLNMNCREQFASHWDFTKTEIELSFRVWPAHPALCWEPLSKRWHINNLNAPKYSPFMSRSKIYIRRISREQQVLFQEYFKKESHLLSVAYAAWFKKVSALKMHNDIDYVRICFGTLFSSSGCEVVLIKKNTWEATLKVSSTKNSAIKFKITNIHHLSEISGGIKGTRKIIEQYQDSLGENLISLLKAYQQASTLQPDGLPFFKLT